MPWLSKEHVSFTGKLASMTRAEAADLLHQHGAVFHRGLTRQTSLLVVGQEGWPLRQNGQLSQRLEKAKLMQERGIKLAILTEEEWLVRLGLDSEAPGIHQRFSLARLCRLLKMPRDRLRTWLRWGLVEPVGSRGGMPYFDFHQVTGVKTLWDLVRAGVPMERLRKSLEQLAKWLPPLGHSLTQLQLLERNGQLLWRLAEGQLAEPSGQLQLDFGGEGKEDSAVMEEFTDVAAERWLREGIALEEQRQLPEAAHAYRQALYQGGPQADVCFNLANVLYAQGQVGQAAERLWQAVELEHDFAAAWNNLGNVLIELGQVEEGLAAYREALKLQPHYADAHYNLADALDSLGRATSAKEHWKAYLALEALGPWADHARKCLSRGR